MQTFYTRVADILGTLAELCSPRTLEEHYGFEDLPTRASRLEGSQPDALNPDIIMTTELD